jgi:hypothetical protein
MAKFDLKKAILENKATFFSSLTEGQFSWMTQDTGQQIGSEEENTIPVYMFDDKGKYYYEKNYDGYGVFGGKDYYDLVAEMNGYTADNAEEFGGMFNDLRGIGIKLAFGELEPKNEGPILFPALVTRPNEFDYKTHDFTKEAKTDPNQSWYAAEEDEDFIDQNDEEEYGYNDDGEEELEEGYMGQFYAPEYLEQKYGKEMADKITAEIEEMDENSYDRFTEFTTAKEVEDYISDIKDMLNLNEVKTTNTKMKISELKARIKEMVLAEAELDIQNSSENNSLYDPLAESDFLAELEGMLDDEEDGLTDLQRYVYNYEKNISGEDEAKKFLGAIKQLEAPQDVYDYYSIKRGWEGSDLDNIFKQVKTKFANLNKTDELTPLQKQAYSYTKERFGFEDAKNSLDQIKTLTTREEFSDWVKKKIEDESNLNENIKPTADIIQKTYNEMFGKNPQTTFADVAKALNTTEQDIALSLFSAPGRPMFEAKKDEETDTEEVTDDVTDGEETVDVTDDFSMEEPQGPGKIDVTQNANADLTGTKKDVQDNLEAALEAARALGDEKLATQVGNTITFFNKQHVVKDTPVAENLNENIEFFEMDSEFEGAMEAGDQTEEEYLRDIIDTPSSQIDLSSYYEVENAIDQGDYSKGQAIKLMKSWAKDKMNELGLDESKNINESMFPMLKKILK